ncbi:carbohydrate ABC transporter permease [Microbacterium sp. HJ5]
MPRRTAVAPYMFLAPFLVLFGVFAVGPSVATFWLAWWDWDPLGSQEWVGSANFARLLTDPRFWTATVNTLVIAGLATAGQVCIGLALAHVIHRATRTTGVRISLLVPYVTSGAAVAILVAQFVDRDYGLLPRLAESFGLTGVDALAHTAGAWAVVSAMVVWRWFGFTALLMVAVLASAPPELFQAAEMDGAGPWAQFRHLSLPLLRPVIVFSILTSIVATLQLFTEPLLADPSGLTCGPARQCQTLALLVYEVGFRDFQFGYAAAISSAVFLIAAGIVGPVFLLLRRVGWTT